MVDLNFTLPPDFLREHTIEIILMETKTRVSIYEDFGKSRMWCSSDKDPSQAVKQAIQKCVESQ